MDKKLTDDIKKARALFLKTYGFTLEDIGRLYGKEVQLYDKEGNPLKRTFIALTKQAVSLWLK